MDHRRASFDRAGGRTRWRDARGLRLPAGRRHLDSLRIPSWSHPLGTPPDPQERRQRGAKEQPRRRLRDNLRQRLSRSLRYASKLSGSIAENGQGGYAVPEGISKGEYCEIAFLPCRIVGARLCDHLIVWVGGER